NPAELKIPSSNLTTALAGSMAGIIAYQRSGEPGRDNADFFVRGITTFGNNTNPLILIDGIELTATDLARLQPDDIESFSVMKDATATALYGARGANGVILVTTKQGAVGPAKISLRLENSVSMPTRNVEFADPVTYMQLANEAVLTRNPLEDLPYKQEKIDNTAAGGNPLVYPANDWHSLLFKDYAINQRVNLSVTGGGGVARYYVAGSFSKDNGILNVDKRNTFNNNINLKSYGLRANVNIDITKTTELIVRLSGNFDDYTGPPDPNTTNSTPVGTEIYNMMVRSNPVKFPVYFPIDEDHKYVKHIMFGNEDNNYRNPYAEMVRGYMNESRSQMLAQLELKQDLKFITEGLSIRSLFNLSRTGSFSVIRKYNPFYYQVASHDRSTGTYKVIRTTPDTGSGAGTEYLDLYESPKSLNSTLYSETVLNYIRTFANKHTVGGLFVLTARESLDANAGSIQLSLPSRNSGLSGRLTYSYGNRYFSEFNFGYNGSERFAANHRFGFFPSAGLGWLISNEDFWKPLKKTVSNLKLRYSYGIVGNDRIGDNNDRFFYLSRLNMSDASKSAYFGSKMNALVSLPGISIQRFASDEITWETSTKQNYAVEVGLWNKVNIIAEYFTEYRNNILMSREYIPSTMGLPSGVTVRANVGEASSRGVDISLDYQQSWNPDFWTSVRANFTYATSRYEVFEEPVYDEPWRSRVGISLKQNYGYIAERLFMDDAEAYNSAPQDFGNSYGGGDIKYSDVNRDGRITPADMVPIGNPTVPEIVYGFGFSLGYKGFDASCFFQGAANESFWISTVDSNSGISTAPFQNQTQLLKAYADSHWSEENQDMYATWPRLSSILHSNNVQTSTWFMRDGTFLRLKQAEIGYTISGKWQEKFHINNFRIYVSGTNLLLFSRFKMWDVEMAGNGLGYPIQRVFNIGMNFTFN
ncbi:MAG: TonB-dependent receptor, partial [Tannerella sp.]|nr:TonB-dependent receptor [Tannerella sp.]